MPLFIPRAGMVPDESHVCQRKIELVYPTLCQGKNKLSGGDIQERQHSERLFNVGGIEQDRGLLLVE